MLFMFNFKRYFNPRSLHGERPDFITSGRRDRYFNPRSLHGERLCS